MAPEQAAAGSPSGTPGDQRPATLADLGEWELIRRLGAFAPPGQFADDAALLPGPRKTATADGLEGAAAGAADSGAALVVNTDVLVEGIHFSDGTTEAADVGWRAAAANLSDLAAMGCTEVVGLTVGLVAPASTPWPWVEGVYGGLAEALAAYGGVLLGGDCSGGAQRMLAITAIGRLAVPADKATPSGGPIRRADGLPGDLLISTGPHGLSRLGLALLQGEIVAGSGPATANCAASPAPGTATPIAPNRPHHPSPHRTLDPVLVQRAITAHRRPRPRFDAVKGLIACRPVGAIWRVGGCDSSDGLAAAAAAIAASSGCGAQLDRSVLPLDPAMASLPEAEAWCLGGGEDFELVLALGPAWAEALMEALPGTAVIGALVAGEAGSLRWADGEPWIGGDGGGAASRGFSHFC